MGAPLPPVDDEAVDDEAVDDEAVDEEEITPELLAAILTERAVGAAAERGAVVAWLRDHAHSRGGMRVDELASAIEAGEHLGDEFR